MYKKAMKELRIDPSEQARLEAELDEQITLAKKLSENVTKPLRWSEEDEARALAELDSVDKL